MQASELHRLMDRDLHLFQTDRLDHEALRSLHDGFDGERDGGVGGQEHEGKIWIDLLDPAQDFEPVHVRHVEVAEHDVGPLGTDLGEPRLAGRGGADRKAPLREVGFQRYPLLLVVLDVENVDLRHQLRG